MFVELHLIQNFAPSNLNRDDTGAPKDCEFGGHRRARISSQCLKRAIRTSFAQERLLPREHLAERTKRVVDEIAQRLVVAGKSEGEARAVVEALLRGIGLSVESDGKTQYLLFLGRDELTRIAALCEEHWDVLSKATADVPETGGDEPPTRGRSTAREAKRRGKAEVPREVQAATLSALDGGKAADLALFGRMLADLPRLNVDAACQVAHALSTNRASMEFDFYTAVDDLRPEDTSGADMLGTVEFNSACFYRYTNVDLSQLMTNLGDDEELARRTLTAFLRAAISAVPTGKQNSMAAQNPPSFVFAVARERGLWSLANAFVNPVRSGGDGLVASSISVLAAYWAQLTAMYGQTGIVTTAAVSLEPTEIAPLRDAHVGTVEELINRIDAAAVFTVPSELQA
ncbi:MAG: type I-E CRISPR-associated protein Cas7/Cse4/CasC [Rhizobiales bacterium]|nr:type I-E CRISPR-associated protein Cas7/Cse4/CasC [Hyphomicrobiales bacterium]